MINYNAGLVLLFVILWVVDNVYELCVIKTFASCLISSAEGYPLFTALGGFLAR